MLDLLREVAPETLHIAVLWDSTTGPSQVRALKAAAQSLALEVQLLEFRRPAEIEVVLRQVTRAPAAALIALSSPLMSGISKRVAEFGARNRLPVISLNESLHGGWGADELWADLSQFYRRTATYVDKILKGSKPADLPVEQPTKFELVINLKTAKALGLTIPPAVLARADEIIQ